MRVGNKTLICVVSCRYDWNIEIVIFIRKVIYPISV